MLVLLLTACNSTQSKMVSDSTNAKVDSLLTLATSHLTMHQNDLKKDEIAEELLTEALSYNSSSIDVLIQRGAARINLLRFQDALSDFEKVLTLDPENSTALTNTALCYNHLKEFDKAITYAEKSIQYNANIGYTYYVLSDSYLYKNDIDNLCKSLKLAAEYNYKPALNRMGLYCKTNFKNLKF